MCARSGIFHNLEQTLHRSEDVLRAVDIRRPRAVFLLALKKRSEQYVFFFFKLLLMKIFLAISMLRMLSTYEIS